MVDEAIAYKSIIMRCDKINKKAYRTLSSDVEMESYQKSMEVAWAQIQKNIFRKRLRQNVDYAGVEIF